MPNNPLYNQLNNNGSNSFMSRFQQFRNSFNGDPKQMIQNMLNSGKITQAQYNNAVQVAQRLQSLLK